MIRIIVFFSWSRLKKNANTDFIRWFWITFFTISAVIYIFSKNWLKNNISPISKKVKLQNWCKIDFLFKITRVITKIRFLRFHVVILICIFSRFWLQISPISKKVNLQKWHQIDFLSNRTRVRADFRFFIYHFGL